jgi:aminotransferase EvaB
MAIPFNDLSRRFQPRRTEFAEQVSQILASGLLIGGPSVQTFERAFAAYCGAEFCIGVANGTDALELALKASGVEPADDVITVANAGGYATTAILAAGARPVYVDIDPHTLQMDPGQIEVALTPATKAIVVTHLFGLMNDVVSIRQRLKELDRSDIVILEDCAQAHGAWREGCAGSLGDVAAFSFYPTKNLGAIGDAGAIVTRSDAIAAKARRLQQYGWSSKYHTALAGGRNSRLDPIQAASLSIQLPLLDEWNERRRAICRQFADRLPNHLALVHAGDRSFVGHLAVIIADDTQTCDRLKRSLADRQIGCDVHYPVLDCDQNGWLGIGGRSECLPVSRAMLGRILSVPCFPELTDAEVEEIGHVLRG